MWRVLNTPVVFLCLFKGKSRFQFQKKKLFQKFQKVQIGIFFFFFEFFFFFFDFDFCLPFFLLKNRWKSRRTGVLRPRVWCMGAPLFSRFLWASWALAATTSSTSFSGSLHWTGIAASFQPGGEQFIEWRLSMWKWWWDYGSSRQ